MGLGDPELVQNRAQKWLILQTAVVGYIVPRRGHPLSFRSGFSGIFFWGGGEDRYRGPSISRDVQTAISQLKAEKDIVIVKADTEKATLILNK